MRTTECRIHGGATRCHPIVSGPNRSLQVILQFHWKTEPHGESRIVDAFANVLVTALKWK